MLISQQQSSHLCVDHLEPISSWLLKLKGCIYKSACCTQSIMIEILTLNFISSKNSFQLISSRADHLVSAYLNIVRPIDHQHWHDTRAWVLLTIVQWNWVTLVQIVLLYCNVDTVSTFSCLTQSVSTGVYFSQKMKFFLHTSKWIPKMS